MGAGHPSGEGGFTLVELLIAMALSLVVLGAAFSAFTYQDKAYRTQAQVTEMQQELRAAADLIVQDVRMAGYGLPGSAVGSYVTWVPMTADPEITDGGAGPDTLSIAAAFDTAGSLAVDALAGTAAIVVGAGEGANFNPAERSAFFLGRNQSGVVRSVVGDTLTVDMDPVAAGVQGMDVDYPAGTPIEAVKVITYHLAGTTLMRNENRGDGDQPVVDHIEDFQVSRAGDTVTVSLTARAAQPDPDYTDPVHGDGYRRLTYAPVVDLRNG
jgi:prepilin-type N-terminal cleavage/methylation domain-containing protein